MLQHVCYKDTVISTKNWRMQWAKHLIGPVTNAKCNSRLKWEVPQNVQLHRNWVGYEVLTAVSTKMAVLWVVATCSLVEVYQRFRGPCCLHHQGYDSSSWWWRQQGPLKRWESSTRLRGATTQKTAIYPLKLSGFRRRSSNAGRFCHNTGACNFMTASVGGC
jgi:hypothetical protein